MKTLTDEEYTSLLDELKARNSDMLNLHLMLSGKAVETDYRGIANEVGRKLDKLKLAKEKLADLKSKVLTLATLLNETRKE